jgi:hypothetical protein
MAPSCSECAIMLRPRGDQFNGLRPTGVLESIARLRQMSVLRAAFHARVLNRISA